jgi:hypothetical protein
MRRGGLRRIASTQVFRVVPHAARWSGPRHALVHRIGPTRRTSPGRGRQALLICLEPAIRGSSPLPPIVSDAPRTIGRSGFLKADDGGKHTKDEQENPHSNLQSRSGSSRQNFKISGSQTTDSDPGILFPHSRRSARRIAANIAKLLALARYCGQPQSYQFACTKPAQCRHFIVSLVSPK